MGHPCSGTPLLLNILGGQEDLQICAFQVSQDLQTLTWRECEGNGGEGHFALQVRLREAVPNVPQAFELICTSKEDTWPEEKASSRAAKAQEELCERLQQENLMLKEMIKRKDATIAELLKDSKSIKTESTSRESDEHLQFREVAILRRKNKRLQSELKSKQHTISGLLKLVERLSQQDETSAHETAEEDDFGTVSKHIIEMKADADVEAIPAKVVRARPGASAASPAPRPAPAVPAPAMPASGSPGRAAAKDEDALLGGELAALADKLQMLERAAAAATQGVAAVSSFQPPSRVAGSAGPSGAAGAATGSGAAEAPSLVGNAGRGCRRKTTKSRALQDLPKLEDWGMLSPKEKKRLVQHLAQTLEPEPSDSEQDDGFPLR
ncbi:Phosphoenolpyruvate carboxylase [Durusdinium trenchii]|uniref:Phosphoenolpyruvate carboxylase n=1 Tax=Durusdinium trenchii TaxID=1381693 RepID=A0ABP0LC89_9DINO